MYILGISAYYHDSSACLLANGEIIAAAQEERFTRIKHDAAFPVNSVAYCLEEANITLDDIDYVTYYDKPFLTFERLLESYLAYAPVGFKSFSRSMPPWIKQKLFIKSEIKKKLKEIDSTFKKSTPLKFCEHHQSHAASAFFPSPFKKSAVLCIDGVGEFATTSAWLGDENTLKPVWEIRFPHSLGLLYSAFSSYIGFKVNSGEYKLMGLAPYGEPKYVDLIYKNLIDVKEDGSFHLNMKYFNFVTGLTMTSKKFHELFGAPPKTFNSEVSQREMDIAKSVQVVVEETVLKLAKSIKKELDVDYLCLAGGVALNCVANGKLYKENLFKDIFIQPAAGDAGGSIGSALLCWYEYLKNQRTTDQITDFMKGAYLGKRFSHIEVERYLRSVGAQFQKFRDFTDLNSSLVQLIKTENVIGMFRGRMEFGPRALCNRSIIGDSRSTEMQKTMNLKIKFRESFRPFAPAVLEEDVNDYFDYQSISPYMLMVAPVLESIRHPYPQDSFTAKEKRDFKKSSLPAITHVDYSARLQTVSSKTNPEFHDLLKKFKIATGCSVLINTSFNVRGEPIVGSIDDAFRCFMSTEIDVLVLENYMIIKKEQPNELLARDWKRSFDLD